MEMSEKIVKLETKIKEMEAKESRPCKEIQVAKICEVPKKETIIKDNSNDLTKKKVKPKRV